MSTANASIERITRTCTPRGGHTLAVDVIGGQAHQRRPCLVWIHGGGLIFGSRTMGPRPFLAQALVDAGFVVASVDHRLAPEAKLPEILDDIAELWRWVHDEGPALFGADPARVCVAGASAGGYLALSAGHRLLPRPRAIASLWGFGDITAPWEAEPSAHYRQAPLVSRAEAEASLALGPLPTATGDDRSRFYLFCRQQGLWLQEVTGHTMPADEAWLRGCCPLFHIGADFPPTMLVHGRVDSDVPASESDRLAARFAELGVPHEYLALDGVGHGFAGATPERVQSTELAVVRFLQSRVAG